MQDLFMHAHAHPFIFFLKKQYTNVQVLFFVFYAVSMAAEQATTTRAPHYPHCLSISGLAWLLPVSGLAPSLGTSSSSSSTLSPQK